MERAIFASARVNESEQRRQQKVDGGDEEEKAAAFIADEMSTPVVAYIAGFSAPPGKTMGHAGAIISGSSGTARYVDSSLERVQVQISGLSDPERYLVACNGRHVPLAATSHAGTWVAGVRYKAWAPYSALHPMIDIHSPLVFDVIDTWSGRSIGGCRYHVVHPGGRNYEVSPVNGEEAEGRRLSRFEPRGHSPGPVGVPVKERNTRFPHTLDLRAPIMPA